jgi:hypothetical protein
MFRVVVVVIGVWGNIPWVFPECSLNVPWMFPELCEWTRSSTPGIRRLVLLTLVWGTHVCKLYSASTLVLFSSASCSWDGGSRASAQLTSNVQYSLNAPWMFLEHSLNVPWMFTECSLNVGEWGVSLTQGELETDLMLRHGFEVWSIWFLNDSFEFWLIRFPTEAISDGSICILWMFTECSLNVHWLFTECSLNVH